MTIPRELMLAKAQMEEIAACSRGAVEVVGEPTVTEAGSLRIVVSVSTKSYRREGGLAFRDRERLVVVVTDMFPLRPPNLYFAHLRFAGTAHVQWGRSICLYQSSETEWVPGDGMFGYMDRVDNWLTAAGAGELDPVDAPLHPPVTYIAASTAIVTKADAPASDYTWVGRADLVTISRHRLDLVGWASLEDWDDIPVVGAPAVAILLPAPMPFEYPATIYALIKSLEVAGITFGTFWRSLRLVAVLTPAGEPGYVVLGAPMRRRAPNEPIRQHLAVWEIVADALQQLRDYIDEDEEELDKVLHWMATANVGWCNVLENRPEVTNRRDEGTRAAGVSGQSIALLGCGALGSAIAEMLVRAGATHLLLVDNKAVGPGLLVRQRYADADIGRPKAKALKDRLDALGQECVIEAKIKDLHRGVLELLEGQAFDLVIDATASRSVAHRLEADLAKSPLTCPLIMLSVSAAAEDGSVVVRMPEHICGPVSMERFFKLLAFQKNYRNPLVETFWPEKPPKMLLPEPGCSSPTFVGSAADIDHHSAGLLNIGLARVATLESDRASMDLCASIWSVQAGVGDRRLGYDIGNPQLISEQNHGFSGLVSAGAQRAISAELKRIARVRSSKVETGGLIFGEIDESHGCIWIDSVSGPPADSQMSPEMFVCGTTGTVALANRRREASGGSSRFIGIWHTHPVSAGKPSDEDMRAMVQLLLLQPNSPRHVVMLIVGFAETKAEANLYLFGRNDFQIVHVGEMDAADD